MRLIIELPELNENRKYQSESVLKNRNGATIYRGFTRLTRETLYRVEGKSYKLVAIIFIGFIY
ncbi:hypothetical protein C7G83_01635 [Siccibacter turicensis]|uniref:Uncharacterized protein n=1 Tax=Siccibacter turicensis TaxID=357233 RepID=A0A2P8VPJ1_9ENTR|nr:hypothetical protein C7G83_01635 [Siccibacter turicensis]